MKRNKLIFLILSMVFVLVLAACGTANEDNAGAGDEAEGEEAAGGKEEITKLTMGFVPSQDADKIADTVKPLAERLSEILGVEVDAQVMTDYVGLVEGMRTQQIDIGFLPPFGFVQAEERADVQVILKAERNGELSYRAQYNVRADLEDINSVEDLVANEGLRWAYADPTSTSGFLFPASQLMDMGVENVDTHFNHLQVGGHDNALIALLNGDADFATTYEDARERIQDDHPDVMDKIKVVGYTDPIPNDTISLRAGLSEEWVQKIKDAFLSFNDDDEMLEVLNNVYNWTGIAEAKSEDYDIVRTTYERFQDQIQ
ncbi:phosphonate ABC transporter, periplasmic phosphonate-binding protein [Caldalkalibacillus thermarum TA2.A1]|uniref:Phosphonate ABC transporter, periplasmic phosphonate-binding protein n=2 Tax=Caldalkalibacillus thermarum (strain TA2.A1) TaxID=986075 RepID=F5LAH2_CALTT|nr:phosphate/phosphite/phosphonate ABC transporter substrate-binding protein [Caldalkalibacillus thermarum]EGL81721.1 phosphonate ABC transporter, periplasmic phosphonate-binding protein [Caldalkalibacillus thermarum TA2.A1]